MEFNSLHSYLEHCFAGNDTVTDAMVKQAKAHYWRRYFDAYQKQRRARIKEFTLGFDSESLQLIQHKKEQLSISEFLYKCVFQVLKGHAITDTKRLGAIHQNQMEIITQLEEFMDSGNTNVTEELMNKMELLEQQILKLKGRDH